MSKNEQDQDGGLKRIDSKEEMFVDAEDDEEFHDDTTSRDSPANVEAENETEEVSSSPVSSERQPSTPLEGDGSGLLHNVLEDGEKEVLTKEIADLRNQLKAFTELQQQSFNNNVELIDNLSKEEVGDSDDKNTRVDGDHNVSLHDLISDCSKYLNTAMDERIRARSTNKELNAVVNAKDQEIDDLHSKVTEVSLSHDVTSSYMDSVQKVWSQSVEESSEKDRETEVVMDRIMGYLAAVVYQEELLDCSIIAKMASVEKSVYWLIERYNWMLYEVDQLKHCSSKVKPDLNIHEAFATVFAAARDEIFELKTKSDELAEKVSHLEDENKKLVEQVDKEKVELEMMNAELGNTKAELEREKTKCANTKEKLSMAVTKGKALVQQRDSLKQSLAEKGSELEKCLTELQVIKSNALGTTELCKEELAKYENLTASLQETLSERDAVFEKFGEILSVIIVPEELESMDIADKLKWLVDDRNELARCKEELVRSENMNTSLQETLSQKNTVLENLETVVSQAGVPEDLQPSDIFEKMKWLVDERNELAGCKEELTNCENLATSLQEMISQRNAISKKIEEILSQVSVPEELQSTDLIDKLKWLVDKTLVLRNISLEFEKLKTALDDLPDSASSFDLESRVGWLKESLELSKSESRRLHDEVASITDSGRNEIERLSASFSAEMQDKDYLKEEFSDLLGKYNDAIEKERLLTLKNDQMLRMLLEHSGLTIDEHETTLDLEQLFHKCFVQIKEQISTSTGTPSIDAEAVERMQSLLYEKDLTIKLNEKLLEDDKELSSQELAALKEEKVSLQKDLERAEEKSAMLREKLSMAVKKGKGLFQDRENLKQQLDEKNSEIEKSRLELQQQESMVSEGRDQISKLEAEIVILKDQRDKLEQFLSDSRRHLDERNSKVEKLQLDLQQQESIITESRDQTNMLSVDLDRIPKLEANLVDMKDQLEQILSDSKQQLDEKNSEIERLRLELQQQESTVTEFRDRVDVLSSDLNQIPGLEAELVATKEQRDQMEKFLLESNNMLQKVFESIDAVVLPVDSVFEEPVEKVNWLAGFISECQNAKTQAEEESVKAKEEASTLIGKLEEAQATMKSLEDTLSAVENDIAKLTEEKKQIEVEKANVELELQEAIEAARSQNSKFSEATEAELEKAREEVSAKTGKLTEAHETIKSLEKSLLQAENNVALLTEQNNDAQVGRIDLENDLKKLKDEAESHATNLADARTAITSLENSLSKAENEVSVLEDEKRVAEQEVSVLNSKLGACIEELAGSSGSMQSRTLELMGHLNSFQKLMNDESLLHTVNKCFEKKFESLKEMDLILKNIKDFFISADSGGPKIHPALEEEDLYMMKHFSADLDNNLDAGTENGEVDAADNPSSCFRKTLEEFHMRNKILVTKFEGFSTSTDEFIAALTSKLQLTRDELIGKFKHMESLKQRVKEMEVCRQEQDKAISMVENNVAILQSVCVDATRQLQSEVNYLLELHPAPHSENVNLSLFPEGIEVDGDDMSGHWKSLEDSKFVETAERLLFASRKIQNITMLLENTRNVVATLKDARVAFGNAVKERDLYQIKVSQLETDLKDQEKEEKSSLMSASQLKTLFHKISGVKIPFAESEVGMPNAESSAPVKKLFDIIDCFNEFHNQVNFLIHDNEELQSNLSVRNLEIERLKEEIATQIRNNPESDKIKNELLELTVNLEKIIEKLGASEFYDNQKTSGAIALLTVLDKQATTLLLDVENSKSRAQELGSKLQVSQQFVDDLSTKVKSLEDSLQARTVQPEIIRERSIFESPSLPDESEISEVEDVGPSLVRNSISPVHSAAHILTLLRKGSTGHLAIDVDSESARLVNSEETDKDKGHVFKSLGTSGLIPKQGKLIADRIDNVWVSGGRVLMSRPRARLGIIAYCLLMHIWILGTIL